MGGMLVGDADSKESLVLVLMAGSRDKKKVVGPTGLGREGAVEEDSLPPACLGDCVEGMMEHWDRE